MRRRLAVESALLVCVFSLAAQNVSSVLTDGNVIKFIETYPTIEAELEKQSADHGEEDPLKKKEDLSSMMTTLFTYNWERIIFQYKDWDVEFMTAKYPAILSGVMIVTFEQGLEGMSSEEQNALESSGMKESFMSAFGQVHQKDKEVVLRHLDDLMLILKFGNDSEEY